MRCIALINRIRIYEKLLHTMDNGHYKDIVKKHIFKTKLYCIMSVIPIDEETLVAKGNTYCLKEYTRLCRRHKSY